MKSKMVDNTPQTPVVPESSSTDFWSSSLDLFPKITMKDVEAFVNVNKSPKSGLTKGYVTWKGKTTTNALPFNGQINGL